MTCRQRLAEGPVGPAEVGITMRGLTSFLIQAAQVVVGLLLLEAGVRWYWREELLRFEPIVPAGVGRYHPEIGWVGNENASLVSHGTGEEVQYKLDGYGLRDDNARLEKSPGSWRVALVGESIAFGFGVRLEDHFSTLLEKALPGLDLINLAFTGYGIDQMVLRFRAEGARWKPDLVLVLVPGWFNARHMHEMRFGRHKSLFVLNHGELTLTHVPVTPPPFVDPYRWLKNNSAAASLLIGSLKTSRAVPDIELENDKKEAADPEKVAACRALGNRLLDELAADVAKVGAPLVLLSAEDDLLNHARATGVEAIDLRDVLDQPENQLPNGLLHLNRRGNQALAEKLKPILEARQQAFKAEGG